LKKKEIKNLGRILALLGAIVCLILGILYILDTPFVLIPSGIAIGLTNLVRGILLIILSLVVFASFGVLDISLKFKVSWVMVLIVGILAWVFGGTLGALLLILSAIVYLIAEL
jgi:hypothetical protein